MKDFKFKISGNEYLVHIANVDGNIAEVEVNGTPYRVELEKELKQTKTPKLVRKESVPTTDSHPTVMKTVSTGSPISGAVKSPLPGVILEVHVKPGDMVKSGQRILVLEAMKMENILRAERDGVVKAVSVKSGDSVAADEVLVEFA